MGACKQRRRRWSTLLALCGMLVIPVQAQQPETEAKLPALAELKEGWNTLAPRGRTSCAVDPNYHFYVRRAAPDRVLVFFEGGGACWDGKSCDPDSPNAVYRREITVAPDQRGGVLNLRRPDNPFLNYSMVVVPYCTGDVHLGDRDTTYTVETANGTRRFAFRHRGQVNAMAVLRWIQANFPAPREILVTGTSAGAVATPFYASLLAGQYPRARVAGLADDAGAYRGSDSANRSPWGVPAVLRRHAGWEGHQQSNGIVGLYVSAARAAPAVKLYQFDHANDQEQRRYRILTGDPQPDIPALLGANRREISAAVPGFRSFTAGGYLHGILIADRFYAYHVNGVRLRDWVAALARGDTVPTVQCTTCDRPELLFTDQDVLLLTRTIELLSVPGRWQSQDPPGACPREPDRYSLRCALLFAQQSLGIAPGNQNTPPAVLEVRLSAAARLHNPASREPVREFNNRPGATVEEMIALLQEVRNRISSQLTRR